MPDQRRLGGGEQGSSFRQREAELGEVMVCPFDLNQSESFGVRCDSFPEHPGLDDESHGGSW